MKRVLIFPEPFRIKNPTLDDQNSYMISSLIDEVEMKEIGDSVEVNTLQESDYAKEIRHIVKAETGLGNCVRRIGDSMYQHLRAKQDID